MKTYYLFCLNLIIFVLISGNARGYELSTHAHLTEQSYQRSVLFSDSRLLKDLGINNTSNAFGESYYDMSGSQIKMRSQYDFEKIKMPNQGKDFLTVQGWLMRGAIREDDYIDSTFPCKIDAPNPEDDKYPDPPSRPLHHFYDPAKDRPLTVGISLGDKAPDWALGTHDSTFVQPLINSEGSRGQNT